MNKPVSGFVHEIFYSFQGEGPWVGKPQWFVRFAGCSRKCKYCDTPGAQSPRPRTGRYFPGYSQKPQILKNPVSSAHVVDLVLKGFQKTNSRPAVAITGGEPLEQPEFLSRVVAEFKKREKQVEILLETNGLEYKNIRQVKREIDYLSLDIKLKSVSGLPQSLRDHGRFFREIRTQQGCVKVIVSPRTTLREVVAAARLIHKNLPKWEMILQPLSGIDWKRAGHQRLLYRFANESSVCHPRVRVIPQMHKWLGID